MRTANGHSYSKKWCWICDGFTQHEDSECLEDDHEENLVEYIENLPNNVERMETLVDEIYMEEEEALLFLEEHNMMEVV